MKKQKLPSNARLMIIATIVLVSIWVTAEAIQFEASRKLILTLILLQVIAFTVLKFNLNNLKNDGNGKYSLRILQTRVSGHNSWVIYLIVILFFLGVVVAAEHWFNLSDYLYIPFTRDP